MSIFSLVVNVLSAAVCLCLTFKIAVFAYLTYGERVSWWWGKKDDRIKLGWADFALCAVWMFDLSLDFLIRFTEELLK